MIEKLPMDFEREEIWKWTNIVTDWINAHIYCLVNRTNVTGQTVKDANHISPSLSQETSSSIEGRAINTVSREPRPGTVSFTSKEILKLEKGIRNQTLDEVEAELDKSKYDYGDCTCKLNLLGKIREMREGKK